ncbi:MAG: 50S ribosomal protein L31 [Candidatus Pacebacteria bacterium]|nr:50S ribosomal protein L31 [Candidatus Paceibacterota bacterium]
MQKGIHPTYNGAAKATCVCGATYKVGSTKDELNVEICSACHPFYTGKENILDTAGRLDRFKKRQATATTLKAKKATKS